eukprot:scaffold829_cov174-Ochromonas_danica.AAC.4
MMRMSNELLKLDKLETETLTQTISYQQPLSLNYLLAEHTLKSNLKIAHNCYKEKRLSFCLILPAAALSYPRLKSWTL